MNLPYAKKLWKSENPEMSNRLDEIHATMDSLRSEESKINRRKLQEIREIKQR